MRSSLAVLATLATLAGLSVPLARAAETAGAEATSDIIQPYVIQVVDGKVDWFAGSVAAWGRTTVVSTRSELALTDRLRLEATLNARAKLVELPGKLHLDAARTIGQEPDLLQALPSIVERGFMADERERRQNQHEVLWALPFEGSGGLVPSILAVSSGAQPPDDIPPALPARPEGEEAPTGIVSDAAGLGASPVVLPRILDEGGSEIASDSTADPACHSAPGFAAYGWETTIDARVAAEAENQRSGDAVARRIGSRPLRLRASAKAGELDGDIVLPASEVARLRSTPHAVDVLNACTLVILLDSPPSLLDTVAPPEQRRPSPPKRRRPIPIEGSPGR